MTKDIVSKLREHLAVPIETEAGALYLMAQVRKLLERDDPEQKRFALWMYCHWALHVDLTSVNTTHDFLKRVDDFITGYVSGFTANPICELDGFDSLFEEFVYLKAFRKQLRDMLISYGLPTGLCDEREMWIAFITAYFGVIEDGSLSCGAKRKCKQAPKKKKDALKAVERVVFSKGPEPSLENPHVPFCILWDICLKDGREFRETLEATSDLDMFSGNFEQTKAAATPTPAA